MISAPVLDALALQQPASPLLAQARLELGRHQGIRTELQRRMLEELDREDPTRLLRLGNALRTFSDPLVYVLLNSDSPEAVIDKEIRLVRYFHTHHRLDVTVHDAHSVTIAHRSITSDPPARVESLYVCGLNIALLDELGCIGLRADVGGPTGRGATTVFADGTFRAPPPTEVSRWRFRWEAFAATRRVMPGLDDFLLAAAVGPDEATPPASRSDLAASALRILAADVARSWSVHELAGHLMLSARSLQRRLLEEGTSFSSLVAEARIGEARRLLRHTSLPVAEVGYICGYSDPAHFSRQFRARTGMAPTGYRQQSPAACAAGGA